MLFAVLSGFLFAFLLLFFRRRLRYYLVRGSVLLPISLFVGFLGFLPEVSSGHERIFHYPWIPSLGIQADFKLDGLSLLFCLLITGIGSLVFLYAAEYLKGGKYIDRFYAYLSLFMAAMLGLVLSDNLLVLFIFWELTSISSFFLIGFTNENEASRKSALLALSVTGGGGFLLMAGFILMGSISSTYSLSEMTQMSHVFHDHPWYVLVLFLVFAGAFTKSAQFPFHFWLPGAMKAPTPVSAYLHSATMVKAGIYLLARLTTILGGHTYWNSTLMLVGGITMLYSALHAIFRIDLKGILAYSTIAALGLLVFLLGIGSPKALQAAAVFVLVHALYKATLFLVTGIIDHETGTRDITLLGGLRKVMLPVAVAGILAALSSAGVPFTFGFIGKDLIYEATLDAGITSGMVTTMAVITNILLLYAGFLAGVRPFTGGLPQKWEFLHLPHWKMWGPPLVLALGGVFFGLFPGVADDSLIRSVVTAMGGGTQSASLKIWHGFNLVLLLSGLTLLLGFILYKFRKVSVEGLRAIGRFERISPQSLIEWVSEKLVVLSAWYTATLHNGYLRTYLLTIVLFLTGLLGYKVFTGVPIYVDYSQLSKVTIYEAVVVLIMIVAIFLIVTTSSRLAAVAAMGVVGYSICLLFVFYSAPDLAMTQFTIDTLTVVLFVLVLFRLPSFLNLTNPKVIFRDAMVAVSFGAVISLITLLVLNEPVNEETSIFYADNAYLLAKGKNVVNVILVDFRGLDTLFEVTVLTIATIGVFSLLKLKIGLSEKE